MNPDPNQQAPVPGAVPNPPADTIPPGAPQPVAYDAQGRPLYSHPPTQAQPQAPAQASAAPIHQYVHVTRPMAPNEVEVPEHIRKRHDEAVKKHPGLNLSEGEYIISAVQRHPIGLVQIWGIAILLILALASVLAGALTGENNFGGQFAELGAAVMILVSVLIFGGAFIAAFVYSNNRFFLTNESVIQEIQVSIFNKHEQTVSLANIEDASYKKAGLLSYIFDYGTIRLSTEGDETTYRFTYVAHPKRHIAVLNNAVESFKNGRPVEPPTDDQPS